MRELLWSIYYIILNVLTQMDTTEDDALSNLVSNSMGFSLSTGQTSVYLVLLCLMNFLPFIYSLTKKADDFYRLRRYIVVRSDSWNFHKHLLKNTLQKLTVVNGAKVISEILICWNLLGYSETILTIVKLNAMYYIIGVMIIGWMELLRVLSEISFKKIFAIIAMGIVILQYFNHRATLFDLVVTPVSLMTITNFQTAFILRAAFALIIFLALVVAIKAREEKRGVL